MNTIGNLTRVIRYIHRQASCFIIGLNVVFTHIPQFSHLKSMSQRSMKGSITIGKDTLTRTRDS